MLKCNHLQKIYQKKYVVNDLGFSVEKGEVFALLGSNGAGKTTTIKMILGLIPMDGGKVEKQEGIQIGYSPEIPYFHPFLTGREVLEFYGGLQGISKKQLKQDIPELLHRVGLEESNTKVRHYSKGMLQRLALAQALLGNPELLILDKPVNGLDPQGIVEIRELILRLNRERQITVLISSHILDELSKIATYYGFIDGGRILKEVSKAELESACRKCIHVEVTDTKVLAHILHTANVDHKILSATSVEIYAKVNISKLAAELAKENCEILSLQEKDEDLESYFFSLVGGSSHE